jgi:predicted short-subunit dehydrogenase-like oxidoreductase (DUF2520 family)
VKTTYLIVGDGRLSRHLQHYFSLLDLPFYVWTRKSTENLDELISSCSRVCLAIRDDALNEFVLEHPVLKSKITVHFSGAQNIAGIFSAHPLMTFGPEVYTRDIYKAIPFVTVEGEPPLSELLPELKNPTAAIPASKKALYHAYCVMTGNFTTLLWQSVMKDFSKDLGLNGDFLKPYLLQTAANLLKDAGQAFTGPIARGDTSTIVRNLDALSGKAYQEIYYAFLNLNLRNQGESHERLRI